MGWSRGISSGVHGWVLLADSGTCLDMTYKVTIETVEEIAGVPDYYETKVVYQQVVDVLDVPQVIKVVNGG
jgi:hypothetical protein